MAAGYVDDLSPEQAMDMLRAEPSATLIDVRSRPEWQFVGLPDLSDVNKAPLLIEWQSYPAMGVNPAFVGTLEAELAKAGASRGAPLLFLCRSGARSRSAAMAMMSAGYSRCYNIAGGFEGPPDDDGHRGLVEGWKALRLPWIQN